MKSDAGLADAGDMDTDTLDPPAPDVVGQDDADAAVAVLDPPVSTEDEPDEANVPAVALPAASPAMDEPASGLGELKPAAGPAASTDPTLAAELQTLADSQRPRSTLRLVLGLPWTLFVGLLAIVDVPFSFLGPRIKGLIGALAVSTAFMAAGVWLYGPRLAPTLRASAPVVAEAPQKPAPAAPAAHGSSH